MSIEYVYNTSFSLVNENKVSKWLNSAVESEGFSIGDVVYAFFDDKDLKEMNNKHLGHDYYTDVISFNDSAEDLLIGNIAISIDRVKDNAATFNSSFEDELLRVMVHGVLHFMGYNDSNEAEKEIMRNKENDKIKMFHAEL